MWLEQKQVALFNSMIYNVSSSMTQDDIGITDRYTARSDVEVRLAALEYQFSLMVKAMEAIGRAATGLDTPPPPLPMVSPVPLLTGKTPGAALRETVPAVEEDLNYEAPKINLQHLLRQPWFAEARSEERYDAAWTDAFVEALMGSEYGEGIARDWAVQGLRERKNKVRGFVVGLLKDAGVLKGSYRAIAAEVGIVVGEGDKKDPYRTFADYMGRGKRQSYALWVKGYVGER